MPTKMKDIAQDLGVSVVTVSKALRNHPDISKPTRERVLQRVQELSYRPNLTARSLVTGRSSLIGLIVPDLIHPFFADVAKGLSLALRQKGYFLVLSSSEEDPELEQQEVEHILAHRLDALVIASCQINAESLARVQRGDTPVILVDRSFKNFRSHFVGSDDYTAGKLATEHLLEIGCRHLAHVRGPENSVGVRRLKGFTDTLKRHGIEPRPELIVHARQVDTEGRLSGADALRKLQRLPEVPDGIFCYNDVLGIGVIAEAIAQGIRVPEELAVIGCGNLHYDNEIRIPLSSIDQRSREIGSRAAALTLDILDLAQSDEGQAGVERSGSDDELREFKSVILQPRLVVRASTTRRTADPARPPVKRGRRS